MSQRVTLDNSELRSRLRATPVSHRTSSYRTRTGSTPAAFGAGKPVIADVVVAKSGGAATITVKPQRPSIERLIVFPAAAEKEMESVANAVARQRAELLEKMSVYHNPLERSSQSPRLSKSAGRPRAAQYLQLKRQTSAITVTTLAQPAPVTPPEPVPTQLVPATKSRDSAPIIVRRSAVWQPVRPATTSQLAPQPAEKRRRGLKLKMTRTKVLMAMATIVFIVGMGVSFMGMHANNQAAAQALAISKQVDKKAATATASQAAEADAPSTTPVDANALKNYAVAPDLARYITIPSIGVHARVLQVGVTADGALGTPANVFDTAWYTGSAKPGQSGATLIDGHVSSWTSHGVFYNIKNLTAGDKIQIEKGDGQTLTYSVVKTVAFDANSVDMQSLMASADSSKSGLNLITCGGKYDRGSKEFTQRIAVYAVLQ